MIDTVLTIGLSHYLVLSGLLFVIGLVGVVMNRRHVIVFLMAIELMLLAATLNLVAFSSFGGGIVGQAFAMIVLTVAAAESAIGLAILVVAFRHRGQIAVDALSEMKG